MIPEAVVERMPTLKDWAIEHDPSKTDLIYKGGFWDQVYLMRDELGFMHPDYDTYTANPPRVLSTHTSKSVLLPVVYFRIPHLEAELLTRFNFHDWKVSVRSRLPVPRSAFHDLIWRPEEDIHKVYCEGFPDDWVHGNIIDHPTHFTVELPSRGLHMMWAFCFILTRTLLDQHRDTG